MSDWDPCSACDGARLHGAHCLAHLTEEEWPSAVQALSEGGDLDARGVEISSELLESLLAAIDPVKSRGPLNWDFTDAQFTGVADFSRIVFAGSASFDQARFLDRTLFAGARFCSAASFKAATFSSLAEFGATLFNVGASFDHCHFGGIASFGGARFGTDMHLVGPMTGPRSWVFLPSSFNHAEFLDNAAFVGTCFLADVTFLQAEFNRVILLATDFQGEADFTGSEFRRSEVTLRRVRFSNDLNFAQTTFERDVVLGPVIGSGTWRFDRARFSQGVRLDGSVGRVSSVGARFDGKTQINVRWAEVNIDDATFGQDSRLAGAAPFHDVDIGEIPDAQAQTCQVDRRLDADPRPRLLSVRQASVDNLAIGNLDLSGCHFSGAHGLDQLRIEADCSFARPPARWRYTKRRTVAEEQQWRARAVPSAGWARGESRPAPWIEPPPEVLDPPQIASIYRALRKALEDRKDEPGAADFYYGEMEMRRHTQSNASGARTDRAERWLLTAYWLLAGYGLRASRGLAALTIVIIASALALHQLGLPHTGPYHGYGGAVLFALEDSVSLFRAPNVGLNAPGQIIEVALRIAGPLCFGLMLVSLRGRLKR